MIEKQTINGTGTFAFTSPELGPFELTTTATVNPASVTFAKLQPGTYSVTETVPAGWALRSATCSDGSDPAAIQLEAHETVTCTFVNELTGTIVIEKKTIHGTGTFAFTSPQLGPFELTTSKEQNPASQTFADLSAGTFSVTETVPSGWRLKSATCSDGSDPASIDLQAGETVTCTFVNKKKHFLFHHLH